MQLPFFHVRLICPGCGPNKAIWRQELSVATWQRKPCLSHRRAGADRNIDEPGALWCTIFRPYCAPSGQSNASRNLKKLRFLMREYVRFCARSRIRNQPNPPSGSSSVGPSSWRNNPAGVELSGIGNPLSMKLHQMLVSVLLAQNLIFPSGRLR